MTETDVAPQRSEVIVPEQAVAPLPDIVTPHQGHRAIKNLFWRVIGGNITGNSEGKVVINDQALEQLSGMREEMVQEAEAITQGALEDKQVKWAEARTQRSAIFIIEAAKEGMLSTVCEGIDARTTAVFVHLSDGIISSSIAPYLVPVVDVMLRSGVHFSDSEQPETEFEKAYDAMRKKNVVAAVVMHAALKKAGREGKLNLKQFNKKFYPDRIADGKDGTEPATSEEALQVEIAARPQPTVETPARPPTKTQSSTLRGYPATDRPQPAERAVSDRSSEALREAADEYNKLRGPIGDKIESYMTGLMTRGVDVDGDDAAFLNAVKYGRINGSFTDDQVRLLQRAGVSVSDATRLCQLWDQVTRQPERYQQRNNPGISWDVQDVRGSLAYSAKVQEATYAVGRDLAEAYVDITQRYQALLTKEPKSENKEWNKYFELVPHPRQPGRKIWVFKWDYANDPVKAREAQRARREFQKKYIDEPMYKFFENIDRDSSRTYRDMFNIVTHGRYLEHVTGLLNGLRRDLEQGQEIRLTDLDDRNVDHRRIGNSYRFTSTMLNYANGLQNYSQIFHDLPIFANDASSIEKWGGILAAIPATQQAMFLDEPLIEISRAVIERHLRSRIALNDGYIPADILSGDWNAKDRIYDLPDVEKIRREIIRAARKMYGPEVEDWEISRAITYGRGIGLLSLRDVEALGSAKSSPGFRGIPDIVSKVWQKHKWNQGRGGAGISLTPQLYGALQVRDNPVDTGVLHRVMTRWNRAMVGKYAHDPAAIQKLAEESFSALGKELNFDMRDTHTTFNEILNSMNLGSLYSRHGWRVEHLMGVDGKEGHLGIQRRMREAGLYADKGWSKHENWSEAEWKTFFDIVTLEIGTGALWFYAGAVDGHFGGMAGDRAKRHFAEMQRQGKIGKHHKDKDYLSGKKTFKPDVEFKVRRSNAGSYETVKETLFNLYQMQVHQSRGEVLSRMSDRNPGTLLLNAIQLVPELAKVYADEGTANDTSVWGTPHPKDDASTLNRQNELKNLFGEHGFNQLVNMRRWVRRLEASYAHDPRFSPAGHPEFRDPPGESKGAERRRKAILENAVADLGIAFEGLRRIDRQRDDLNNVRRNSDLKMDRSHLDDPILRDLIFGAVGNHSGRQQGLMEIFDASDRDFGKDGEVNQHNFYYGLARAWTETNRDAQIDTTDIDNYQIYDGIGGAGESVIKRLIGDLPGWNEVSQKLMSLDEMIEKIGRTGNLEEFYELCGEIFNLKGVCGQENAEKAVFNIASTVATYMWEHEMTRIPFFANTPMGFYIEKELSIGNKLSLSKLQFGRYAHTMDTNQIREMFHTLGYDLGVIAIEGRHSVQHGELAFDAETAEYAISEVAFAGFMQIALLLLILYIKKALEENNGGNQH